LKIIINLFNRAQFIPIYEYAYFADLKIGLKNSVQIFAQKLQFFQVKRVMINGGRTRLLDKLLVFYFQMLSCIKEFAVTNGFVDNKP
jgi:hypothetical protein